MAEKELRKMNRTELIEIIYALQQNDKSLQLEIEEMRRELEDRTIRKESAGSIAEAALSLNHIFEDAEAAAKQYLESLKAANAPQECEKLREETQRECEKLREETQRECEKLRKETQQECTALREQALRQAQDKIDIVNQEIKEILNKYPLLRDYLEKEQGTGGDGI